MAYCLFFFCCLWSKIIMIGHWRYVGLYIVYISLPVKAYTAVAIDAAVVIVYVNIIDSLAGHEP